MRLLYTLSITEEVHHVKIVFLKHFMWTHFFSFAFLLWCFSPEVLQHSKMKNLEKKKPNKNRLLCVVPANGNEWLLAGAKFRIPWKCLATLFLPRRDVEIKEIERMKIQPQHCHWTCPAQPDASAVEEWRKKKKNNTQQHPHSRASTHASERKRICLCSLTEFTRTRHNAPQALPASIYKLKALHSVWLCVVTMNGGPHRFLILLFGASGFLGLLDDGVEGDAQPAHARQVGHVDVKLQPLVPQRLRAHRHLGAGHHLAEQLAAVEQAGLHHKLEGERRVI